MAALIPMAGTVANAGNVGTVVLNAFSGIYPNQGGGEFTAYTAPSLIAANYSTEALINNQGTWNGTTQGFETFCIEVGVDFTPGNWGNNNPYYYTEGLTAQPLSGPSTGGSGSNRALSKGAAWLYFEFATGNLGSFAYTYGSGRESDDNLLQAAIWAFQGGQTYGSYPSLTDTENGSNPFYNAAIGQFGDLAGADAAYSGGGVDILQLWSSYNPITDTYSGAAQNQLVLTGNPFTPHPVPDGGTTLILLGGALAGLRALRRKLS